MRNKSREAFRNEWKYLISTSEKEMLMLRLKPFLQPDPHAGEGGYYIRSLYFDDYAHSAYYDKVGGTDKRRKYRIRLYNLDDSFIRLECKIKDGVYISKLSAPLTREECSRILAGDYDFLRCHRYDLCRQFYFEIVAAVMRPAVYVDYEREPYVMESGNVRITFDTDVRGAYPGYCITERDMPFHYVLEPGKLILEVKFTEFLPRIVQDVLPLRAAEMSAVSKYTLCYDKISYMSAVEAE